MTVGLDCLESEEEAEDSREDWCNSRDLDWVDEEVEIKIEIKEEGDALEEGKGSKEDEARARELITEEEEDLTWGHVCSVSGIITTRQGQQVDVLIHLGHQLLR